MTSIGDNNAMTGSGRNAMTANGGKTNGTPRSCKASSLRSHLCRSLSLAGRIPTGYIEAVSVEKAKKKEKGEHYAEKSIGDCSDGIFSVGDRFAGDGRKRSSRQAEQT